MEENRWKVKESKLEGPLQNRDQLFQNFYHRSVTQILQFQPIPNKLQSIVNALSIIYRHSKISWKHLDYWTQHSSNAGNSRCYGWISHNFRWRKLSLGTNDPWRSIWSWVVRILHWSGKLQSFKRVINKWCLKWVRVQSRWKVTKFCQKN